MAVLVFYHAINRFDLSLKFELSGSFRKGKGGVKDVVKYLLDALSIKNYFKMCETALNFNIYRLLFPANLSHLKATYFMDESIKVIRSFIKAEISMFQLPFSNHILGVNFEDLNRIYHYFQTILKIRSLERSNICFLLYLVVLEIWCIWRDRIL